jgi:hypothetical protein
MSTGFDTLSRQSPSKQSLTLVVGVALRVAEGVLVGTPPPMPCGEAGPDAEVVALGDAAPAPSGDEPQAASANVSTGT